MTLRSAVSGRFDRTALRRLLWPVAWSGTVPQSEREAQEEDLRELVDEAEAALVADPDAVEVEIAQGELVAVIVGDTAALRREIEDVIGCARAQGWTGASEEYELTELDVASIITALGRKPTRDEWEEAGFGYVGSRHTEAVVAPSPRGWSRH